MSDDAVAKQKEEISRQQYLYTAAVLTFMAFVGNLTKPLGTRLQFGIAVAMLVGALVLGVYIVIVCHREYCARNGKPMGWWGAFAHSFQEHKGALFCNGLIFITAVGLITYLASGIGFLGLPAKTQLNGEQGGAANWSQPIRSETNRTSSAAGSRR